MVSGYVLFAIVMAISVILLVCWQIVNSYPSMAPTLELVHVLVRHGDRNPSSSELYPTNPYLNETFYAPYGYGQLTNKGIDSLYKVGQRLRKRYDSFLGTEWNINAVDVQSTAKNRTRMSSAALLAGLWPPSGPQVWNSEFPWLPIPYSYVAAENDKTLDPFSACSKSFWDELYHILATKEIANYMERYDETLEIMSLNMNQTITSPDAFVLYFGFLIQDQLGFPLENWAKAIYPEPLKSLAIDYYYIETNTTTMRQIMTGYFLKKILVDTERKIKNNPDMFGKKMFVYVAHEINLATFLLALDAFKVTEVPPYGSYVIVEVHKVEGQYKIKLFYEDYSTSEPHDLTVPGCSDFCPFDDFVTLLKNIVPSESDTVCTG